PLPTTCASPVPVTLPAFGSRGFVRGPFPVTGRYNNIPGVLFGPIAGDGRSITFTTCFSGTSSWDSTISLFAAAAAPSLFQCGGTVFSLATNNNASPACQIGTSLSSLTYIVLNRVTYWLMWSAACVAKHGTCHNPSTRPLLLGSKLPAVGDPSPRAALPMA
ncbi:hypothetical protein QJQ45_018256, partial [Haematococcus lacustris]